MMSMRGAARAHGRNGPPGADGALASTIATLREVRIELAQLAAWLAR